MPGSYGVLRHETTLRLVARSAAAQLVERLLP